MGSLRGDYGGIPAHDVEDVTRREDGIFAEHTPKPPRFSKSGQEPTLPENSPRTSAQTHIL
jgi:hypothetical protein